MSVEVSRYHAGCYWGARDEDAEQCVRALFNFLQCVSRNNIYFDQWYLPGKTRGNALNNKIELDEFGIRRLLKRYAPKGSTDDPTEMIKTFQLWNGVAQPHSVGVLLGCGNVLTGLRGLVSNSCSVTLGRSVLESPKGMLHSGVSIIECMIETWSPDWAIIEPDIRRDEIRDKIADGHIDGENVCAEFLRVGWVTYVSDRITRQLSYQSSVKVQRMRGGKTIFLCDEEFDLDNEDHIRAYRSAATWLHASIGDKQTKDRRE